MESTQSKLIKFMVRNTVRRQFSTQNLNLKMLRILDTPVVPSVLFPNSNISKKEIAGSTVHFINSTEKQADKLLVYIPGGAFIAGPTRSHWRLLAKLYKNTDYNVAMIDYPKAPENDHKVTQKSIHAVYRFLTNNFDMQQLVIGGDSAGGNLTLSTALWAKDNHLPLPKSLLALSPAIDMTMSNEQGWEIAKADPFLALDGVATCAKWYVNGGNPFDACFSVIYGNLQGLPPIHIFCGTNDMLYPDGKKFAQKAKKAGVKVNYFEYPEMMHTWMLFPMPEAQKAIKEMISLL